MWLSDLASLPGLIRDLIALQQETNLLLRELIVATTGTRAQTLRSPVATDRPRTKLTASTVTRHGREDWAAIQAKDREKTTAPWRGDPPGDPSRPTSALDRPPDPAGAP